MAYVIQAKSLLSVTFIFWLRGRRASPPANELGETYSGLMVRIPGPVGAAVFGGVRALATTGLWAALFPTLRKADRLN